MSRPNSGYARFQDTLSPSDNISNRYLPSTNRHNQSTSQDPPPSSLSPSSSLANTSRSKIASSRRQRNNNANRNSNLATSGSLSVPSSFGDNPLRSQRSLVMKHRLRKLNDYYEDQQQQHQPISKPLPPLPPGIEDGIDEGTGVGGEGRGPKRKGATVNGKGFRLSLVGVNTQPSSEGMDTSGLLNYVQNDDDTQCRDESYEMRAGAQFKRENDAKEEYNHDHHHHHRTLGDVFHCDTPDRHLFPYRTWKENMHALKTFLRRFYLILLIIPAWVLPIVMTRAAAENNSEEIKPGLELGNAEGAQGPQLDKWVNMLIFLLNLLVMMHLGKAAGACLEELVPKLGMGIVSIFDAMTSSSVELAVAAFALIKGMVRVVQAAMLGAILNNLLLNQNIQADTSQTGMNLLMIVCISYVVPIALDTTFVGVRVSALPDDLNPAQFAEQKKHIQDDVNIDLWNISIFMAFLMLILYGCCLAYQFDSRSFMVTPEAKHTEEHTVHRRNVHYWFAGWGYGAMLAAQIYSANLLVHAVEALGKQFQLNDSFVGFVLLPIVLIADLQEEVIAIKESKANRVDRSIALMIGSCMQIALLVTPLLVLLGWAIGKQMTFRFTVLEGAILSGSVLIVNYLLQDNTTNWLEGCMLLAAFFMCAISFYYDVTPFESHGSASGGVPGPKDGGGGH
ncbi:hypothetical protein BGZ65_005187 [Modicella reniformis]|uniref:Sodium/calcium exchanger membrane region domain-containing protein n=1 Tax=Modicella reniformis TaxID=1440133 RepID=A0A9P6ST74_9FUNG|nr:hypothetical protein BGZ65_005187 [Modicella reniformis]